MSFPTSRSEILHRIESINPTAYSKTRNYTDGAVTRLSPYLTHGAISTKQVADTVLQKHSLKSSYKLVQELAWREFFQTVFKAKQEEIWTDLRYEQTEVKHSEIPRQLIEVNIEINEIDRAVKDLITTGYMHNHQRMWLAALVTNHAHYHWKLPSQWLYYHLLDGDLASNTLSWQWVAGTFSSKKYYANQENINTYSKSSQNGTYLDTPYDILPDVDISESWSESLPVNMLQTDLNHFPTLDKPIDNYLVYHPWMIDPEWRKDEDKKRILILEEDHFKNYPISPSRVHFIEGLAKEIPGLEIYTVPDTSAIQGTNLTTREHPAISHWNIPKDTQSVLFPELYGTYFKNFFSFWKKAEKYV